MALSDYKVNKHKVIKNNIVLSWNWDGLTEDVCGICSASFQECCTGCSKAGSSCPPVIGECTHEFHQHCMDTWLKKRKEELDCPNCRVIWKVKKTFGSKFI